MASRPLDIEYIPVGKKESDSCIMLRSTAFLMSSSLVLMYIQPFFWLKDHPDVVYLQMMRKRAKDLFEHFNLLMRLYWKIDLSPLKLDWSVQVPYGVPDPDRHFNDMMFRYIILDLYYCNVLRLKLNGYHLVICK